MSTSGSSSSLSRSRSIEDAPPSITSTRGILMSQEDRDIPPAFIPSASLLSARRPSWTPSLPLELSYHPRMNRINSRAIPDVPILDVPQAGSLPSSPEDGGNFRRSLQIDMKGLVGDAVGNVSVMGMELFLYMS